MLDYLVELLDPSSRSLNEGEEAPSHDEESSSQEAAWLLLFLLTGLIICQMAETALHRYHIFWLPGSGAVILIGFIMGYAVKALAQKRHDDKFLVNLEFDEHLFSLILLPIIIFQSGYSLSLAHFFKRFGRILTYAFLGTAITTAFTGLCIIGLSSANLLGALKFSWMEAFAFASLISAIDPVATLCTFGALKVEPILSITIMGESVINDAVALALYRSFDGFIVKGYDGWGSIGRQVAVFVVLVLGSTLIGIGVGFLCSIHTKFISQKMGMNCQATVVIMWSYVSYIAAESCHVSGIIASMSAGIMMNHYSKKNFTRAQKVYINQVLLLLANFSEMAIFFLAGTSIALYLGEADYALVFWMIPILLVGRALNVFPLSAFYNKVDPKDPVTKKEQFVMWHAGLRGAIAFSIALHFPNTENNLRASIIDTTSMLIFLTVFTLGGSTGFVLKKMGIQRGAEHHSKEQKAQTILETKENQTWKQGFSNFDQKYMQRLLVKEKSRPGGRMFEENRRHNSDEFPGSNARLTVHEEHDTMHDGHDEDTFVKGAGGGVHLFTGNLDQPAGHPGGPNLTQNVL